jgi:hypothetical protein
MPFDLDRDLDDALAEFEREEAGDTKLEQIMTETLKELDAEGQAATSCPNSDALGGLSSELLRAWNVEAKALGRIERKAKRRASAQHLARSYRIMEMAPHQVIFVSTEPTPCFFITFQIRHLI